MNVKTILLAGAAVVTLALPAAANETSLDSSLSGVYVGGFGGYSWTDTDVSGGPSFNVDGGDYGLFVGYQLGGFFDRTMGLGLTGALEGHYAHSNADDSDGATDAEKNHEWGVSFRPGLTWIDQYSPFGMKPYGILGYRRAEFSVDAPAGTGSENFNGFELGIGTELLAYQQFGVRLDYSHVFYKERGGVDPDENDLRLGVAYHF